MNSITKKILLYFLAASTIIVSYSSARSVNFPDRAYSFLTTSDSLLSISRTSLINKIDNEAFTNSWADVVELSELACLSSGKGVIIAIIDSGIDIYNPMFNSLILSNSWNFADSNRIIMDQNGHGTNVKYKESNKRELGCSTLDIDCIWLLDSYCCDNRKVNL